MIVRPLAALAAILFSVPAVAQTQLGSIQGQVVDEKTGAPVRFATVVLIGPVSQRPLAPSNMLPPSMPLPASDVRIAADEQGRFTFKDVAAGDYAVGAERDGYMPTLYGPTRAARALVSVAAGKPASGIRIAMPPCGVIAGKVVNEKGEPVPNAELVALRYYYGTWMWRPPVTRETPLKAFTNDLGEFRIPNLGAGAYILRAAAPPQTAGGKAPKLSYPSMFYPNALSPEDGMPISVASGDVSRAEMQLRPGPAYRVSGMIDSSNADGEVCFGLAPKNYHSSVTQVVGRVVRFARDGMFIIDDVPPGSYVLSAAVCRSVVPLGAIQQIEVAGKVEGLNIQLKAGQPLSGVVRSDGAKVAGLRLALFSPELLPGFVARSVVGEDGTFVFEHVLPRHHIVGFGGLPDGTYVKSVKYAGREVPATGFEIDREGSLEIGLSSQGAAQLTGAVTDKSGNPVPYAMVMALPSDDGAAESARDIIADERGNYSFSALRPGSYKVMAWEVRYNPFGIESADPVLPNLIAPNARTVMLHPGTPASLGLTLNTQDDVNRARAAAGMTPPKNP